MIAATFVLTLACQDPLAAVEADQARRVAVVAAATPSVCAVMKMDAPGGGSGVIFDPAGFVLTNYHVVGEPVDPDEDDDGPSFPLPGLFGGDDEEEEEKPDRPYYPPMKVGLPDGRLYPAKVLGIDPGSDLAVLYLGERPDGEPWPYRPLGDSDALLAGETVFAMGNPFLLATDFTPTVTFGVVSGTHRYRGGSGNRMLVYPDCVQVDAAVNPGNSGGPLFNELGRVVGINGRITLRDRGRVNTGVGFAISSRQIRNFLADLMAGRHTEHGTLDLNAYFMNSPHEERRGVFVQATFADSVARSQGVDIGDELLTFNGARIRSANQLTNLVGVLPEGAWVSLGFRKAEDGGGYGPPRTVHLKLARLDTGSSSREDWIASEEMRRIAARSLARPVGTHEEAVGHASVVLTAPDGTTTTFRRRGERLRIELGDRVLVRTGPGEGFTLTGGEVAEPGLEEQALLDRHFACNPFLFAGAERREMIADALLHGGVFVHGRPAYAFAIPGEITRHVYFYEDGRPAGFALRDPVRKALVEVRVPAPGATDRDVRLVVDGDTMETGWKLTVDRSEPAVRLFRRPR